MYDIILIDTNIKDAQHFTTLLNNHFNFKNLGDLAYFLNLEVAQNHTCTLIKQCVLEEKFEASRRGLLPSISFAKHTQASHLAERGPKARA